MPTRTPVESLDDPRVAHFRDLRDAHLKSRENLFIAEGRLVAPMLAAGRTRFACHSVLGTPIALDAVNDQLAAAPDTLPIYEAPQHVMDDIAGFHIHRGLIAAGIRTPTPTAQSLLATTGELANARLIVAVEDLTNHDNLGGIFRNAAAFAADAVLTTPACCDPLYRKAIRVSMAHALRIPNASWAGSSGGVHHLHDLGFTTLALTPNPDADPLDHALHSLPADARLALLIGAEGDGLQPATLAHAHARTRIPMAPNIDSLNTATATGIALHAAAHHLGLLNH